MIAFDDWFDKIPQWARPDYADAESAFSAGMTKASEVVSALENHEQRRAAGERSQYESGWRDAIDYATQAIEKARDGK